MIARRLLYLISGLIMMLTLGSCVHEFPVAGDSETYALDLIFSTDLPQWEHYHEGRSISGTLPPTKGVRDEGLMRYIIRVFPIVDGKVSNYHAREFTFSRDVTGGYDCTREIQIPAGQYRVMVWADLSKSEDADPYYDTERFEEILLQGEHCPNDDYRDAFRGTVDITVEPSTDYRDMPHRVVEMQRPMAKFEFVTTDLVEFFERETRAYRELGELGENSSNLPDGTRAPSLTDYEVIFHYLGYMPSSYSIISDKPVDSKTGVKFSSQLRQINKDEATLGFDYVFVNGSQTSVTLRLELINKEGKQISLTDPIEVPLKRSNHTVVRGSFLMMESTGSTGINPDYEGDFNLFL